MQQQHPYKFLPSSHQEHSGEWRVETCKIRGAAGQWRVEPISQSDFLICLAASDFGVLADLDWGKGERVNQKRGMETLTGKRVKQKGQFASCFSFQQKS
jgi:hypothetical protein